MQNLGKVLNSLIHSRINVLEIISFLTVVLNRIRLGSFKNKSSRIVVPLGIEFRFALTCKDQLVQLSRN